VGHGTKATVGIAVGLALVGCGGSGGSLSAPSTEPSATAPAPQIGHGDPLLGIPEGAEDYVTGPRMRGTVVAGADLRPLGGFSVVEHGVTAPNPPIVTAQDGVFLVDLTDEASPAFAVERDGWVRTIMLTSDQGRLYFKGEYKIEVFEVGDEDAASLEESGRPRDEATGRVVVNFQPLGSAGSVRVDLQAPGVEGFRYDGDDRLVPGATFDEDPLAGEVVYPDVAPGVWPVVVTAPPGMDCRGPSALPSEAGTYTRAYFFCRSTEEWTRDPGGQE